MTENKEVFRIGTGAGFSADRLDSAVELVEHGDLDAIVFECVGERTLAFGHRDRMADANAGYNKLLPQRMRAMLPLIRRHGTCLITNMGVANPAAAAARTAEIARDLGLAGLKIAWIEGDDVTPSITPDTALPEFGGRVRDVGRPMVGANAYIGADALLPALADGADVIIAGRIADPSLFLAPLRHAFGWAEDDWPVLGAGTLVGHLMECGTQITGGYFADPGLKDMPNLAFVGMPIAEVGADGGATITKLERAGGCVTAATVKEQMLYEVHDPAAYMTPDVTADFTGVEISDDDRDRVAVVGAGGRARPQLLKVTVAFDGGFLAEGEVSYAGPGAAARSRLAGEIVETRMREVHGRQEPLRTDLIGLNALHGSLDRPDADGDGSTDVRLRAAMRTTDREAAEMLLWEVESLLCDGPAGGGGFRGRIDPSVTTHSAFLPRDAVPTRTDAIVV